MTMAVGSVWLLLVVTLLSGAAASIKYPRSGAKKGP